MALKDSPKLVELKFWILKILNDPELLPKDGVTFCNIAVNRICRAMGYDNLDGLTANQIYDQLQKDLPMIKIEDALECAADGDVIIASQKGDPHGHCCIVWPEKPQVFSGHWNCYVPRVANVGKENGIMGANYAFIEKPDFFRYVR